jgi:hypothetical protein
MSLIIYLPPFSFILKLDKIDFKINYILLHK